VVVHALTEDARRQDITFWSFLVKLVGTLWLASYVAGVSQDVWMTVAVAVGHPTAWAFAWLISRTDPQAGHLR